MHFSKDDLCSERQFFKIMLMYFFSIHFADQFDFSHLYLLSKNVA